MPRTVSQRLSVSVIIPTYNRATLVSEAIDSALGQTRVPDEIIVVDDGSTDGTADVLRRYGAPVRVVSQANRGRSAARNTGLQEARGDLILFLDSDDLLVPQCVEHCARILEREPETAVVYTDAHVIDREGRIVGRYSEALRGARPSGMILGELARRCFLTVSSMVRRASLPEVAFEVGMEHCEDYDLWRRLSARCQFHYLAEPLLCYRFHEGMTNAVQHQNILTSEIEVQRRFMGMDEFARLSRRERARVYCTHGIKNALVDRSDVARQYFRKALVTSPTYPGGPALTLLSLGGSRFLKYAILKRRKLAGNQLGSQAGPLAVVRQPRKDGEEFAAAPASAVASAGALVGESS
ncbi:MAG: glycosyltransferase family 2 protein [Pirellulales bacterium]